MTQISYIFQHSNMLHLLHTDGKHRVWLWKSSAFDRDGPERDAYTHIINGRTGRRVCEMTHYKETIIFYPLFLHIPGSFATEKVWRALSNDMDRRVVQNITEATICGFSSEHCCSKFWTIEGLPKGVAFWSPMDRQVAENKRMIKMAAISDNTLQSMTDFRSPNYIK